MQELFTLACCWTHRQAVLFEQSSVGGCHSDTDFPTSFGWQCCLFVFNLRLGHLDPKGRGFLQVRVCSVAGCSWQAGCAVPPEGCSAVCVCVFVPGATVEVVTWQRGFLGSCSLLLLHVQNHIGGLWALGKGERENCCLSGQYWQVTLRF